MCCPTLELAEGVMRLWHGVFLPRALQLRWLSRWLVFRMSQSVRRMHLQYWCLVVTHSM